MHSDGGVASGSQQSDVLDEALHAARDIMVGQHVRYLQLSGGRQRALLEGQKGMLYKQIDVVADPQLPVLPMMWASTVRIV